MKTFYAIGGVGKTARAGRAALAGHARSWRSAAALALALVVSIFIGCGGGGGSVAGVGSGGTGSFASGSISGFGSIVVNGIHYDESAASAAGAIQNEDGLVGSSASLKLGMVVNVTGSAISNSSTLPSATANAVSFGSELLGPIEGSINLASKTLVVLGQTVAVTGSTFFDDTLAGGLLALQAGDVVEVYGFYDPASNTVSATRIEKSGAADFKLSGTVGNLNTASSSFSIGSRMVSYANISPASQVPALANGQLVRVKAKNTLTKAGLLDATRIRVHGLGGLGSPGVGDRDEASVEGTVNAFTSATAFSVNGIAVDARNALVSGGAAVALGVRVEVEGSTSGNVLVARKVNVKTSSDIDRDEFQISGTVASLNTSVKTMVVRGVVVNYAGIVQYDNGVEADLGLIPAPVVEVKGIRTAGGTAVQAQRIRFVK